MIEANSASSSANDVSIRTRVFGWFARISRVASIPLPSARRTSMTTTSGRVRSASSIGLSNGPRLAGHHDVVRGLEEGLDTAADDLVIVDEQDTQRRLVRGPHRLRRY